MGWLGGDRMFVVSTAFAAVCNAWWRVGIKPWRGQVHVNVHAKAGLLFRCPPDYCFAMLSFRLQE
jgi:hypothetical protein